jgi:hypothetical protein
MCDPSALIVDSFYFGGEDEEHDDDDDDSHITIRFAVRSPGKEVTEDYGMDAEMLEATDVPASSAMQRTSRNREIRTIPRCHAPGSKYLDIANSLPFYGSMVCAPEIWSNDLGMGKITSQTTAADVSSPAQVAHCLTLQL